MLTREQAERKFKSLQRMTIARGCTSHEAATAARLRAALAKKWGLSGAPSSEEWRPDFDARYRRAEDRAAMRFRWEYRRCGKRNCHCAAKASNQHGPYRYGKKREGRKVRSVYLGR